MKTLFIDGRDYETPRALHEGLQRHVERLVHQLGTHRLRLSDGTPRGRVLFPPTQRLVVVAKAPAPQGGLLRAVAEDDLARAFVSA